MQMAFRESDLASSPWMQGQCCSPGYTCPLIMSYSSEQKGHRKSQQAVTILLSHLHVFQNAPQQHSLHLRQAIQENIKAHLHMQLLEHVFSKLFKFPSLNFQQRFNLMQFGLEIKQTMCFQCVWALSLLLLLHQLYQQWSDSNHPFPFTDSFTPGIFTPGSTHSQQLIILIINLSDCLDS